MQPSWLAPFTKYELDNIFFDEMFASPGIPRPQYEALFQALLTLSSEELDHYQQAADLSFLHQDWVGLFYREGNNGRFPSR